MRRASAGIGGTGIWLAAVSLIAVGCGGGSPGSAPVMVAAEPSGAGGGSGGEYAPAARSYRGEDSESDSGSDDGFDVSLESERRAVVAQATAPSPPPPPPPPTTTTGTTTPPARVSPSDIDTSGPLLIYEADLHLAVSDVRAKQREGIESVRAMGGFIARQDETTVVLRVPAARFDEALRALEALGDVLHRTVQSHDVTEEFRDLDVRLRNALAMRDRLEQLLERAGNVQDSIVVERELERITTMIEQMRGRMRFLADRIAYSTITLRLQGMPREGLGPASSQFRLPFPWLDQLGLARLLDLSDAE
ncbi:MAG: DUF4349 domain-containing protein [Deltaproteobacteria bacterium]|nr:DUF4349 domain-containing protein [Deltaproteobacteria bacterium]